MRKCELCDSLAKMYCDSDQASLCWDCDTNVHGVNFLVSKHSRTLLCHVCQSLTPWTGTGPKLCPTVSVCGNCGNNREERGNEDDNNNNDDDDLDRADDSTDEDDQSSDSSSKDGDEDDEENQVVPRSYSTPSPPISSSSNNNEECSSRWCDSDGRVSQEDFLEAQAQ